MRIHGIPILTTCIIIYFLFTIQARADFDCTLLAKKAYPSVVLLTSYNDKGSQVSQGSGFFINAKGDIITNRHVINGSFRIDVKTSDGIKLKIKKVLAEDRESDIVKISVERLPNKITPLKCSTNIPQPGQKILVIGSPLGLEKTVSEGIVSAIREIEPFGKILQVTAPISPGSSGSPVLDKNGDVIGIITFQYTEGQNLNFAISADKIRGLKENPLPLTEWSIKSKSKSTINDPIYSKAMRFFVSGNYLMSIECLKDLSTGETPDTIACFIAGLSYQSLGSINEARDMYERIIKIEPGNIPARLNLGVVYAKLGRINDEVEEYKNILKISPHYAPAHSNLGCAYKELKLLDSAIEEFKLAVLNDPLNSSYHYLLASAYREKGMFDNAVTEFKKSIELAPEYLHPYYGLGFTYTIGKRDPSSAITVYKQIFLMNPDDPAAHLGLGIAYLFSSDKDNIMKEYAWLLEHDEEKARALKKIMDDYIDMLSIGSK